MRRKGQVIVTAVFIMVVLSIIGMAVVSMLSTASFSIFKTLHGIQALNVAEGGIRFTIATSLAADSDWSDNTDFGPVNLNPGTFSIHYISKAKKSCVFESTGVVSGVSRTVRIGLKKEGGLPSQFAEYVAYGGRAAALGSELLFDNNSRCYGNLYYYGPIRFAGNSRQSGGVVKSTSITPAPAVGIPTYYASWEQISSVDELAFDSNYYRYWLTLAASHDTAATYVANSGNLNLNGGTAYYRYVLLSGTASITGPGTICATGGTGTQNYGAFRVTGNAKINNAVKIVSRGNAGGGANLRAAVFNPTAGNNIFNASVEVIARCLIDARSTTKFPANSVLYVDTADSSNYAIKGTGNSILRSHVLAPEGIIRIWNNSTMEGRLYGESLWTSNNAMFFGSSWVFKGVYSGSEVQDYSTLIQTQEGMPETLPPGFGTAEGLSSLEVTDWLEIY